MYGSTAVAGAMHTLATRKADVALAENMHEGKAQNRGYVVTSMSGQTIELKRTDVEGCLVLADVLWHHVANPCGCGGLGLRIKASW